MGEIGRAVLASVVRRLKTVKVGSEAQIVSRVTSHIVDGGLGHGLSAILVFVAVRLAQKYEAA